MQAILAVESM